MRTSRRRTQLLLCLSLSALACGILFQSTTVVQEDESNVSTLTIAIDKPLLLDDTTAERWQQQIAVMTTYLQERGASVQAYSDDQYDGLRASIAFPDLASLNAQQSGDVLSLFQTFNLRRWRGEFVLEARTSSALIRQRIQQITGLNDADLFLVQFPLSLSLQLPGELTTSNADHIASDGTQTWAINWLTDEEHLLYANSRVPLIPPVITEPAAGTRIKDASAGVDFAGTGEPGADIRLFRIEGEKRTLLARGQIGADRRWVLPAVQLGEPGEYVLQAEATTDHDSALSDQPRIEYRPLEPIVFVPGYYACTEGVLQADIKWHWGIYPSDDPGWATTGLLPGVTTFFYGPLLEYFISQGYQLQKNLFVACYNWATSLPEEAAKLKEILDWARTYNSSQLPVTIITHSNGALVARYLIQDQPTRTVNQVSDLIMIAPPNHGVAKAYYAWEGGDFSQEGFIVRRIIEAALWRRCGIWAPIAGLPGYADRLREYHVKVHDCVRYGGLISPIPYDLATASNESIMSLAWLLPAWDVLLKGDLQPYPHAPIRRLNTPDQIDALFKGIQRNVYILAGDAGIATIQTIPVVSRSAKDNPLWENGKPDPNRPAVMGAGDGTIWLASAFLPEAADRYPGRYRPYLPYPSLVHARFCTAALLARELCTLVNNSVVDDMAVLTDISKIIRENPPADRETQTASGDFLIIWVESPVSLLVTDPNGRRVGADSAGNLINEIPNTAYGDTQNSLGPKFIIVSDPVPGDYHFDLTGLAAGEYELYGLSTTSDEPLIAEHGQIAAGEKVTYQAKHHAAPAASATSSRGASAVLFVVLALAGGVTAGVVFWRRRRRARRTAGERGTLDGQDYPDFDSPPKKRWWRRQKDDFEDW